MRKYGARLVAVALGAAGLLAVPGTQSSAEASCVRQRERTAKDPANSDLFNASIDCDGMWGIKTAESVDTIRGWYKDDSGTWRNSSYGWQTFNTTASEEKIVGNTVDGRRLRAESTFRAQDVLYRF